MSLAHILAPQIAKKAAELEAELGQAAGYLKKPTLEVGPVQATPAQPDSQVEKWVAEKDASYARFGATPEDRAKWADYNRARYSSFLGEPGLEIGPVEAKPAPQMSPVKGSTAQLQPVGGPAMDHPKIQGALRSAVGAVGAMQRMDPKEQSGWHAFSRGFYDNVDQANKPGTPFLGLAPPPSGPPEQATMGGQGVIDELGRPVYATPTPAKTDRRGRAFLELGDGPVATAENGQAVDKRGRQVGYLEQDPNVRTMDRRERDVGMGENDLMAQQTYEKRYAEHLQAQEDNRVNGRPTDKFPTGYFKGMSKEKIKEIREGVKLLRMQRSGTRT